MDLPDAGSERSAGLVGRSVELGQLARAVDQLLGGSGGILEIAGEPGVGKTRLLLELSADARSRGVQVLEGRATEAENALGFGIYQDALGDRFRAEAAGPLLPTGLTDPLQPLLGDGPASEFSADRPVSTGAERVRIHQRVRSLLGRWAEQAPTLLILDDAHWADPGSVELTEHLIRHRVPGPLLLAITHRPRQTALRLLDVLGRADQSGPAERVEVGPLSAAESAALARLAGGSGQPTGQADGRPQHWDEIHRESGGNPLLLLALADLAGSGEAGDARPAGTGGRTLGQPAAVLLGELALVPDDGRLLTAAAAVLGERFLVEAMAEVAELGTERAHRAATALIRRDILRPVPGTPQLTFRHPVLRRLVYQHADPVWRVGAHRRALARLTRADAPAVERARHAERCLVDADPQVVRILEEAAEAALRTAPGDAARWLGVALQAIPGTPAEQDRRLRLEIARTLALAASGRLSESRDLLHEVLARVPTDPLDRRLETATLCARTERMLGHYSEAEALLRGELPRIEGWSSPQAVGLMTEYGTVALLTGGFAEADPFVGRAVLMARELGDPPAEAMALAVRGLGSICLGRVDQARRELAAGAALADRLSDADLAREPEALGQLGWGELFAEQYTDAARHHDRGLRLTRRNGQDHVVPHLLIGIGFRQLWTGELDRAVRTAEEAEEVSRELGSRELMALSMALRAAAMDSTTRPAVDGPVLVLAERAVRLAPSEGWWSRSTAAVHAQALLAAGQAERCARVLLDAGGGPELPRTQVILRPLWYALLSAAALATGDVAEADAWAALADTVANRLGLRGPQGFARRAGGLVAAARGEPSRAVEYLAAAAGWFQEAGFAVQRALTLVIGAPIAAAVGDRRQADAWLDEADRLAAETGAGSIAAQAAAVRRGLLERSGTAGQAPPDPGPGLALLTKRERQIAALAVEGTRTREIADRLFLSPRTVDTHLAKIYRKLGVTSRTALGALLAAEGGRQALGVDGP
ncbi:DNA-binding CsgD family transcriptional regulator/RecA/RadA recombinase [Kitasatospora gansuensis]|uniref:DNA-binding CsgD family transcriptional regulator/RecA/RadA recombinase n=1 Tax=Kitasatospora gansuensis TaxID=258050 RepID=A0A7W7SIW3_9ACTN|nr:LuxR family transcriptional regulator [Kitasatospora gansuensis]MBB4951182.1 DNA-binding CsgD family transcriptional regulator/RecA/RadA recombinase [Kitasatospora gansuensis]